MIPSLSSFTDELAKTAGPRLDKIIEVLKQMGVRGAVRNDMRFMPPGKLSALGGGAPASAMMRGLGKTSSPLGQTMRKVAGNWAGLGGAIGPIGAAVGAEDGRGLAAFGGSLAGGVAGVKGGALLAATLSALSKGKISPAKAYGIMTSAGGLGGSMLGGHLLGAKPKSGGLGKAASDAAPNVEDVLSEMMSQYRTEEPEQPFWADQGSTDPHGVSDPAYGHGTGLGKGKKPVPAPKKAPPKKAAPPKKMAPPRKTAPPAPRMGPKMLASSPPALGKVAAQFFANLR